jgi:polyphosphate kinase 2 (PPK2 family)
MTDVDPDESEHYEKKKDVAGELEAQRKRIGGLQERLYAENERGLLIVLQAMDTGRKDGTIKHVFRGVNPRGAGSPPSRPRAQRRQTTTSCGATTRASPPADVSASSTAPTTKTS